MLNTAIKEKLLQLPDLQQLIGELQTALEDEHRRRLDFYEWAEADVKVEFINGVVIENSPAIFDAEINRATLKNLLTKFL